MKVFKQILREFLAPFIISIVWVFVNLANSPDKWTLLAAVNIFGPTFFLISWLSGQIFRVKKQIAVESNLLRIKDDLEAVADDIRLQTKEVSRYVTGGSAFIHFLPQVYHSLPLNNGLPLLALTNGNYPLYDVKAVLSNALNQGYPEMEINIGNSKDKVASMHILPIDMIGVSEHKLRLWITARNGAYYQDVWLKKISDLWTFAIRVRDGDNLIKLEQVDPDFPVRGQDAFVGFNDPTDSDD